MGCGHRASSQAEVSELGRTVAALRVQNTAYRRQLEELENRVFILNDQLDSRKVSAERAAVPDLPKVTLRPRPVADAPGAAPTTEPADPSADPGDPLVEYVGDAAQENARRPVLRLYGDETPVFSTRDEPGGSRSPSSSSSSSTWIGKPVAVAGEAGRIEPRASAAPRPGGGSSGAASPVDLYRRSLDALRARRHDEATAGFREFLRSHAVPDLADNAQYWLGECFYDKKDYPAAAREFRRVVERYPQGNKVPDALLKMAYAYLAVGSTDAGRHTLEQLVRSYPRHETAGIAAARVAELGRAAAAPAATSPSNTPTRSPRPAEELP